MLALYESFKKRYKQSMNTEIIKAAEMRRMFMSSLLFLQLHDYIEIFQIIRIKFYLEKNDAVGVFNYSTGIRCEKVFNFFVLKWLELGSALAAGHDWIIRGATVRTMF